MVYLLMVVDDCLFEIFYGDWDGQLNVDLMIKYLDFFDFLINDVWVVYVLVVNGESFVSVEVWV